MSRTDKARMRRRTVGYVFQDFNLLPGLTAAFLRDGQVIDQTAPLPGPESLLTSGGPGTPGAAVLGTVAGYVSVAIRAARRSGRLDDQGG
jgi:hypothetical protein